MVTLRPANLDDMGWFHTLACEPTARALSFTTEAPSWLGHRMWYAELLGSQDALAWVVESPEPVGVVYVRRRAKDATISVNLSPETRGKGYGPLAIGQATSHAQTAWGLPVTAYIRFDNTPSAIAFSRAGYVYWGSATIKGHFTLTYRYR